MPDKLKPVKKRKRSKEKERHIILREIYRHYIDFEDYYLTTGNHIIEVPEGYYSLDAEFDFNEDGRTEKIGYSNNLSEAITISFLDLKYGLEELTPRKRHAFLLNVIYDMTQEDAARIMDITPVSIGQYVNASCKFLAKRYFAEKEAI